MASAVEAIAHNHNFIEQIILALGAGIKVGLTLEILLQQVSNRFTLVNSLVVNGSNGYYGFYVATMPRFLLYGYKNEICLHACAILKPGNSKMSRGIKTTVKHVPSFLFLTEIKRVA